MTPPILVFQVTYTFFASDHLGQVLKKVARTITSAFNAPNPQYQNIEDALVYLTKLESHPKWLTEMTYGWCAVIWKNHQSFENWKALLFLCLEVGFRCYDQKKFLNIDLTHTEHHQKLAEVVFKSGHDERIADLLCALVTCSDSEPGPAIKTFSIYKQYIVNLQDNFTEPFTPRLQHLVIYSIDEIGYEGFKEVGMERFVGLLNHLHIDVEIDAEHIDSEIKIPVWWAETLFPIAQSLEGLQHLSIQSWKLLVELTVKYRWDFENTIFIPDVTSTLLKAQEWDKLECYMGIVWVHWPEETDNIPQDLKHAMELLFHHRPGAAKKLTQWMEKAGWYVPESSKKIFRQVYEAVLQVPFHIH